MTHYFMMDHYSRMKDNFKDLSEDDLSEIKSQLEDVLVLISEEKILNVKVENAIAEEDLSLSDPEPKDIHLRDPNGLSMKILGDTLYIGTNGDWVNFSMVYDFLGIDWLSYFED